MDNQEYEGEGYPLPPVVLPELPAKIVKNPLDNIVTVLNPFKQQRFKLDDSSIQNIQFIGDNSLCALGCSNGTIKILSIKDNVTQFILKSNDQSPISSIANNSNQNSIKNAIMVTHSEGTVEYWHATSRQLLFSKKYDEFLHCCEISPDGSCYAFAGENGKIRFGHLNKGEVVEAETGHLGSHNNRVFCLKWDPNNSNIIVSGGWDQAVHFWDLRSKTSVKKLFGYYIGGQAIDIRGDQILLGNNKSENPLRIYDLKADKVRHINWHLTSPAQNKYTTGVLNCYFMPDNNILACTPKNQVRIFHNQKFVGEYEKMDEQQLKLYCMQKHPKSNKLVLGWNDGSVSRMSYSL